MKLKTFFKSSCLLMTLCVSTGMNYQNNNIENISVNSSAQYPDKSVSINNYQTSKKQHVMTAEQQQKIDKQLTLLNKTVNDFQINVLEKDSTRTKNELLRLEQNRFVNSNSKKNDAIPSTPLVLLDKINKPIHLRSNQVTVATRHQNENTNRASNRNKINITSHLRMLQHKLDDIALKNIEEYGTALGDTTKPSKALDIDSNSGYSINTLLKENNDVAITETGIDYWTTVHSIESKQGKLLYRPRNKDRNCTNTSGPCGHHQLTVQALKDIGCNSKQCRIDRLNYKKSLSLSKKLLALNEKRLKKNGISRLEDYQKYLIHQQGANGIKNIIAASQGKKTLSKEIKKNMANNSPYSYSQLKRMGSTIAAKKFMKHWKHKWKKEQRLVLASVSNSTDSLINSSFVPTFSDTDLNFALNIKF